MQLTKPPSAQKRELIDRSAFRLGKQGLYGLPSDVELIQPLGPVQVVGHDHLIIADLA
jgi:hypothetical protein